VGHLFVNFFSSIQITEFTLEEDREISVHRTFQNLKFKQRVQVSPKVLFRAIGKTNSSIGTLWVSRVYKYQALSYQNGRWVKALSYGELQERRLPEVIKTG